MELKIKMPDLSANEAEIRVVRWMIEPGQRIQRGRILLEVETDKAIVEVESIASGILVEICALPEQKVTTGEVIAVIDVSEG